MFVTIRLDKLIMNMTLDSVKIKILRIYLEGTTNIVPWAVLITNLFLFSHNNRNLQRASHPKFCNMWYIESILRAPWLDWFRFSFSLYNNIIIQNNKCKYEYDLSKCQEVSSPTGWLEVPQMYWKKISSLLASVIKKLTLNPGFLSLENSNCRPS